FFFIFTFHGAVGIRNGRPYQFAEKKRYWLHDAFVALPDGDLAVQLLTFGGDPAALDDGVYVTSVWIVLA
ncbi:hypothetical protein J3R83DRAFT_1569, partial [Lanmaoa asiatica]